MSKRTLLNDSEFGTWRYMNQNLVPGPNRKEHIHSLIPAHRLVGLVRRGMGITLALQ